MAQVPTAYSFDAPTDFINFSSLDAEEDTENIDSWFDEKANLENKFLRQSGIGEPFQGKTSLRKAKLQQGCVTPLKAVDNTYYKETEKENLQKQSIPSNDCPSLNAKRAVTGTTPIQPQRRSVRLSAQKDLEQKEKNHVASVEMKAKRCTAPTTDYPPNKKMKVSHKKKPEEEEEGSAPATSRKDETLERAKGKHTVPAVPPAREKTVKSTEEQELEKSLRMQQEVVEMRKKNEEFKKLALAGPGQPVKKSTSQVTKTVDFHFLTDERIKQHPKSQEEYKEVNFMSELRKHSSTPARGTRGCTIIKPFNLSKGKKRTFDEAASTYVPIAQQVEAFQKQSPH